MILPIQRSAATGAARVVLIGGVVTVIVTGKPGSKGCIPVHGTVLIDANNIGFAPRIYLSKFDFIETSVAYLAALLCLRLLGSF